MATYTPQCMWPGRSAVTVDNSADAWQRPWCNVKSGNGNVALKGGRFMHCAGSPSSRQPLYSGYMFRFRRSAGVQSAVERGAVTPRCAQSRSGRRPQETAPCRLPRRRQLPAGHTWAPVPPSSCWGTGTWAPTPASSHCWDQGCGLAAKAWKACTVYRAVGGAAGARG